jgi:hypothetical protein
MDLSTMISIVALIISLGGLAVTLWATRISKRSLEHAIGVQKRSDLKEFERVHAELLNQISDSRAILDKTRIEIGTLQANFHAEPVAVKALLANFTGLFSEYLPKVEQAIRQCDELWTDVSGWSSDKAHADLMRARAVLYRSLKDDETVREAGIYLVNSFKVKLELARQQVRADLASR